MARIIVATDDGEVMNTWEDAEDEIGDISRHMAAYSLMADIKEQVDMARQREARNERGEREAAS